MVLLLLIFLNIKWLCLDGRNKRQKYTVPKRPVSLGGTLPTIRQYDIFLLSKDLNKIITKGMQAVILEKWDEDSFLIEFVREDSTNHEFNGDNTFTVDRSFIGEVVWTAPK